MLCNGDNIQSAYGEDHVVSHFTPEDTEVFTHISDRHSFTGCQIIRFTIAYARDDVESSCGVHTTVVGNVGDAVTSKFHFPD
jgi:hypothetical protein